MYAVLGALFHKASAAELRAIAYLCEGRLLPAFSGLELGVGEHMLMRAIGSAVEIPESEIEAAYKMIGDLGSVAEQMSREGKHRALTISRAYAQLLKIARTAGAGSVERKITLMANLLRQSSPREVRYLVRFVEGRWRLGVGPITFLEAIARRFPERKLARTSLERAYNLCSDLGLVLAAVRASGLGGLKQFKAEVGHPIRFMLAERLPSAEAILERLGVCSVESKLDGFRCELHKKGKHLEIFSRNLERTTDMFPDLVRAASDELRGFSGILDSEAVTFNESTGELYPFQVTVQRKRRYSIEEMAREFPLVLFVFDVLCANGKDYTSKPYEARRKLLEKLLSTKGRIRIVDRVIAKTTEELQRVFDRQVEQGLEGIVAKRLDAAYEAGARNFNWIKLKQTYRGELEDTVDAVIVGYLRGRGARASLGIGAVLVSVYDPKTDSFPTVAKVGTGFSNEEWMDLRKKLDNDRVTRKPARVRSRMIPDVWTQPKYVVQVLADQVTRSPVHTCALDQKGSGLALRFPRVVGGIRKDKKPEDATTVTEIRHLYRLHA